MFFFLRIYRSVPSSLLTFFYNFVAQISNSNGGGLFGYARWSPFPRLSFFQAVWQYFCSAPFPPNATVATRESKRERVETGSPEWWKRSGRSTQWMVLTIWPFFLSTGLILRHNDRFFFFFFLRIIWLCSSLKGFEKCWGCKKASLLVDIHWLNFHKVGGHLIKKKKKKKSEKSGNDLFRSFSITGKKKNFFFLLLLKVDLMQ